jgi:hypothetical protein
MAADSFDFSVWRRYLPAKRVLNACGHADSFNLWGVSGRGGCGPNDHPDRVVALRIPVKA